MNWFRERVWPVFEGLSARPCLWRRRCLAVLHCTLGHFLAHARSEPGAKDVALPSVAFMHPPRRAHQVYAEKGGHVFFMLQHLCKGVWQRGRATEKRMRTVLARGKGGHVSLPLHLGKAVWQRDRAIEKRVRAECQTAHSSRPADWSFPPPPRPLTHRRRGTSQLFQ